jgi:hypothetical protein
MTVCCLVHYRQRLSIRNGGKLFQGRDEGALRSLLTVLLTRQSLGRRFLSSDAIFNDPSNLSLCDQEVVARSRFTRQDLLIRTTRFGMDDWHPRHARQRRKVEMSENYIERCFVADWRRHFHHLSRTEFEFTPEAAETLPPGAQTPMATWRPMASFERSAGEWLHRRVLSSLPASFGTAAPPGSPSSA